MNAHNAMTIFAFWQNCFIFEKFSNTLHLPSKQIPDNAPASRQYCLEHLCGGVYALVEGGQGDLSHVEHPGVGLARADERREKVVWDG